MKKIIVLGIVLLSLCGCGKSNKNVLNVLNWSSYIPDEVIHTFEDEYNIDVNYSTYSSNEELLAKVSSAKTGTYDLVFPSDYMVEILLQKDMLQKLDKNKLSNVGNIKNIYLRKYYDFHSEYSLPFLATAPIIVYNSDVIKEDITSYNDLLNSKYRGEVVLLDDQRIVIGMALLATGHDMNATGEKALEEAKDWLLELKKNVKVFDSDSPKSFLISREVNLGVIWSAEAALAMQENESIKVVYPNEGYALSLDNYSILKGAKNIDNAHLFIDYLLRGDVMAKIIEAYPYFNVNKETDNYLSESYLNNEACNISNFYLQKGIFVRNIDAFIKDYDRVWAEIK